MEKHTVNEVTNVKNTSKIVLSGLTVAIYIAIMYVTQSFSFGQYQIRIATGLYSLAYYYPFLCLPLGFSNMVSNIFFGGDIINGLFGFCAGALTCECICMLKKVTKNKYIIVTPIALLPSLIISVWLSYKFHISYLIMFVSLLVGQTISAYTFGLLILSICERFKDKLK